MGNVFDFTREIIGITDTFSFNIKGVRRYSGVRGQRMFSIKQPGSWGLQVPGGVQGHHSGGGHPQDLLAFSSSK